MIYICKQQKKIMNCLKCKNIIDSKRIKIIEGSLQTRLISSFHYKQLKEIINAIIPKTTIRKETVDDKTNEEIIFIFKNWQNSKVYK